MNDQMFQARMREMEGTIGRMPDPQCEELMKLLEETHQRHDMLKQVIAQRNEDLGNLSLALNYLLFDLEATRRENAAMRNHMDDQDSGDHDSKAGLE